ncbi:MAG TPA: hypothetical protein VFW59_09865 [Gallionella sp.]|nr:hypothetical protein [Gallionella sp.]
MLSALTGCASMSGARTQTIAVQTVQDHKEVTAAGCILANGVGRWFITTPGQIIINKNIDDLTVECSKEDVGSGSETIASKANGGMWGNVLLGGPIGYVVDRKSGAGYDYPQTIVVELKKIEKAEERDGTTETKTDDGWSPPAAIEQPAAGEQTAAPEVRQDPPTQAPPAEERHTQAPPAKNKLVEQKTAPANDWQPPPTEAAGTATPYISNY